VAARDEDTSRGGAGSPPRQSVARAKSALRSGPRRSDWKDVAAGAVGVRPPESQMPQVVLDRDDR